MIRVFDLGFGQSGAVLDAPVHRLEAFVDVAAVEEIDERAGDYRLIVRAHGEIGIVPLAEDAEALEIGALEIDVLFGVLAAGAADFDGGHVRLFAAELAIDLDFDGQAVAIPAGDVGRIEAGHGARLDDEILQDFVERGSEVNSPVGVGRAIVQHPHGLAGARGANLRVETFLFPPLDELGLGLRQVGLHGEGGFGQIDGLLQIIRWRDPFSGLIPW